MADLKKIKLKPFQSNLASSFIKKTYEILEDQQFPDIVDWNDEGNALVIKKPQEFAQQVLPTYFKHGNLTSFVRQLNMYDFHKRRTSKYDHVYYHDLFHKGKKHLLKEIKRKNQENTLSNIQKAIDALEAVKESEKNEPSSNSYEYENQLLKKLNKDALARIISLENKVKDLTIQNQELWYQISHQNQKEDVLVSFFASFMKRKGIPLDQLSKTLATQLNLPCLNLALKSGPFSNTSSQPFGMERHTGNERPKSPTNTTNFFNFDENQKNLPSFNDISPNFSSLRPPNKPIQHINTSEYMSSQFEPSSIEFDSSNMQRPMSKHFTFPMQGWEAQQKMETNQPAYVYPGYKGFEGGVEKRNLNPNIQKLSKEPELLGKRKNNIGNDNIRDGTKQIKRDGHEMIINYDKRAPFGEIEGSFIKEDLGWNLMANKINSYDEILTENQDQDGRDLDLTDFSWHVK